MQDSSRTPFDQQRVITTQEVILEPAFAYMAAVLGQDGVGRFFRRDELPNTHAVVPDPTANLDVISRMLYVDGTSTPTAKHQEHRLQLVAHLPRGTDLAGKTADVCLICSEEIPFDVRAEQVLPAQCRRKHVWGEHCAVRRKRLSGTDAPRTSGRCSITYRLITTPFVRTCSTCHSKSLLPSPQTPESPLSIEQDMLRAATSCPRCGGLWRSVV